MSEQTFRYQADRAAAVLSAWALQQGSTLEGADAQQGLMGLLIKAEQAAHAAGWATSWADDTTGEYGFVVGGSVPAAQKLAAQGDQLATVYLAAQQIARQSQAEITPAPLVTASANSELSSYDVVPAVATLVVVAVAIAVAAVAAAIAVVAWSEATKVTVQAQTQQRLQLVNAALDAASSTNPNVRNNPDLWKFLQGSAQSLGSGSEFPWGSLLVVGGVLVVGKLVWDRVTG